MSIEQMQTIARLRSHGVLDTSLLKLIETTPRSDFLPPSLHERTWDDAPIPTLLKQVMESPTHAGVILHHLSLEPTHTVVEIGTGAGYLTTLLARLVRRVYTAERVQPLLAHAEERFRALDVFNVTTRFCNASTGLPRHAPYDAIVTTAAIPGIPRNLVEQLKPTGRLIFPLLGENEQTLTLIVPNHEPQPLLPCSYPLLSAEEPT